MTDTIKKDPTEWTAADLAQDLWTARRIMARGALIGILAAVAFFILSVPQYKATMLISPTIRSGMPDISTPPANNPALSRDYILQSFGPPDSTDFMRFEAIMRETSVAARLLQDDDIKAGLKKARRLWICPGAPKDPAGLSSWLQRNIEIIPVGATRLRRVTFYHSDPKFAVALLDALYKKTDGLMREELRVKTENRISYLKEEIGETPNPDNRRALADLLRDQEQIRMILAVNEPFAASLAEPPSASAHPVWPRKALVLLAFMFIGALGGYAVHGFRRA